MRPRNRSIDDCITTFKYWNSKHKVRNPRAVYRTLNPNTNVEQRDRLNRTQKRCAKLESVYAHLQNEHHTSLLRNTTILHDLHRHLDTLTDQLTQTKRTLESTRIEAQTKERDRLVIEKQWHQDRLKWEEERGQWERRRDEQLKAMNVQWSMERESGAEEVRKLRDRVLDLQVRLCHDSLSIYLSLSPSLMITSNLFLFLVWDWATVARTQYIRLWSETSFNGSGFEPRSLSQRSAGNVNTRITEQYSRSNESCVLFFVLMSLIINNKMNRKAKGQQWE